MVTCENTKTCPFFNEDVGFSPELNAAMKEQFCLGDNGNCARLKASEILGGLEFVPKDMLPTDQGRLQELSAG